MKKILELHEEKDEWGEVYYQELRDENGMVFSCSNLEPEDACIGRDIFDAYDFIEAIKYGMKLANEGYSGIE